MKRILTLLLLAFWFSAVAQCEADHVVEASSFMYTPNTLTIGQGESVAWINLGGTHDVNGDVDSQTGIPFGNPVPFYIGAVSGAPDGECIGTHTFNVPGLYIYDCSIGNHAAQGMVGIIFVNAGTPGCTHPEACNYSSEATFNDGSCTYAEEFYDCEGNCLNDFDGDGVCWELEVVGCTHAIACNYNPEATDDDGSCIYPGDACQDDNETTINDTINEVCECVGIELQETCNYIGHPEWLNMGLGVYSSEFSLIDSSLTGYNLIVGEAFETELVLNMPLVFTDEVTGGSFQVLSWSNLVTDNVPPGVDLNVPETMEGGSQACLEMSGVDYPTEEGLFEVSIVGEVAMNFFGTPISIGDVSTEFLIQVSSNPNGVPGCMYEAASNYMPWATFDVGVCEFEGCTDPEALNFSPAHTLEDGSCLYTDPSGCDENEVDHQLCLEGTVWSEELGGCVVANVSDTDFDGCVGINDFLVHLSNFGSGCGPEPAWACGDPLEYQGYDYETVQIGEQCWFAENLRAENYRNSETIPTAPENVNWVNATFGGMVTVYSDAEGECGHYSPTINACDASQSLPEYGRLYNKDAVQDERGLCPSEWHVADQNEFLFLRDAFSASDLKAVDGWYEGENGSNATGFDANPNGLRNGNSGQLNNGGYQANWWAGDSGFASMNNSASMLTVILDYGNITGRFGLGIRCIKD